METTTLIQHILPEHNNAIASIIRKSLEEFGANKKGTVYFDDSTDHLFELFNNPSKNFYLILTHNNEVVGGAGIYNTAGLPNNTCELVKMYLKKEVRGLGFGYKLITQCLQMAKNMGYKTVYLETMPELAKAVDVYKKFGFINLTQPMGNSGHCGCDIWMKKEL